MSHSTQESTAPAGGGVAQKAGGRGPAPRWLPAAGIAVWLLLAFAFIVMFVPVYFTGDPSGARVQLSDYFPWHYGFLVAHVAFGLVAMATAPFQVWPRFRNRYPALHRVMGRLHIFAGVLPAGLMALVITPFAAGPVGNAFGAVLWLGATIMGFRRVRQRRYTEHRRWMIYSFALCMQIIEGRIMVLTIPLLPGFTPDRMPLLLETASWIGILLNLLIAQWWLERTAGVRVTPVARRRETIAADRP
ncbi:hypothetical protein Misp01_09150 [Microtetraspora sp. NBRC 13810]|uniref:DUF2306 domain-containing protein n=1 Tax=Microtetraspora sp. NBRC 13810 TaxID=3030990 RepID=UPI0024A51212|nr:DUF2306 domain-containing protein [Microtetraspora sp. NBRC 13810]GLW05785.1 hypothetical protein Misp01_09150 [Microtetraspora sp. NBRC 13810]